MTAKERLRDPVQVTLGVLAIAGFIWACAITFAGLQSKADAKEQIAPIVAAAKEHKDDYTGFKLQVSTDVGVLKAQNENMSSIFNNVSMLSFEL